MKLKISIHWAAAASLVLAATVGASQSIAQDPPEACEDPYLRDIQQTSEAIRHEGADVAAHLKRAAAYQELGKHGKAAADYSQAIALGAAGVEVYLARGKCFNVEGQNQAALQDILHAQELAPASPESLHRLADIHSSMGNYDEARMAFMEGLKLSPTNAPLLTCQARLYRNMGDLTAAEHGFNAAIALDPEYIYAYYCRGLLFATMGEHAKAFTDFTAVVDAPPTCYLRHIQMSSYVARARSARALGLGGPAVDLVKAGLIAARLKVIARSIQAAELGKFNVPRARAAGK